MFVVFCNDNSLFLDVIFPEKPISAGAADYFLNPQFLAVKFKFKQKLAEIFAVYDIAPPPPPLSSTLRGPCSA